MTERTACAQQVQKENPYDGYVEPGDPGPDPVSLYGNVAEGQSDGDQQTKDAQFGVAFTKVDKSE
jgi:hypothetical protein